MTAATIVDAPAAPPGLNRRAQMSFLVFSSWTIAGLFLDGWAHRHGKPESFFTPWHGLLYSGFVAGMLWGVLETRRAMRRGEEVHQDRWVVLGGLLFLAAGVGDMSWHMVFGIEKDLEALLSPTHLLLMVAGLMLTTAPLRSAWRGAGLRRLRDLGAQVGALSLSAALVSFFLMFANPFAPGESTSSGHAPLDASAVLITNAVLLAPIVWLATRTQLPRGAAGLHLGVAVMLMLTLDGFAKWPLLLAAAAGGAAAELVRSRTGTRGGLATFAAAIAIAMWTTYYGLMASLYGHEAPVELWTGPVVLAACTGIALAWLTSPDFTA